MVGDANGSVDEHAEYEAIFGDTKAVGRVSKANKAIIKNSFNEVIDIARQASKQTGLSVGQVYDQWNGKRTRHNIKSNKWNSYQVYNREHAAQERARLSQGEGYHSLRCTYSPRIFWLGQMSWKVCILAAPISNNITDMSRRLGAKESDIPRLCYKEFKKKYGKKADDILESYRQLRELSGASNTTVARRKQEWNAWWSDIKQKVCRHARILNAREIDVFLRRTLVTSCMASAFRLWRSATSSTPTHRWP